jgi:hypothetical protein
VADKPTPEEQEIARFQAKLDAAPEGGRLAANMRLRIAMVHAAKETDPNVRARLEGAARSTHAEAVAPKPEKA